MKIKYGIELSDSILNSHIKYLINKTFRLLPIREENGDWEGALNSIIEEVSGLCSLLKDYNHKNCLLFSLLCKLEGLFLLKDEEDFQLYRKTIFECLTLYDQVAEENQ